jgi:hypothetical protein
MARPEPEVSCFSPDVTPAPPIRPKSADFQGILAKSLKN